MADVERGRSISLPGVDALDNPVWHALRQEQRAFGLVGRRAACYREGISPLAGVADGGEDGLLELASLVRPGRFVVLFGHASLGATALAWWRPVGEARVSQWVCAVDARERRPPDGAWTELSDCHIPAMSRLAKATDPGPFERETHRLGGYLGIFAEGRLVAMAGERMRIAPAARGAPGFREVSSVCTAPTHRGKGHAHVLVREIVRRAHAADCMPFLHVRTGGKAEAQATRLYEKIGFEKRRDTTMFTLVRRRLVRRRM